jgi:SHO1 osmosensor
MLHVFNSMGTGGLTPPGRHSRRATMNRQSTSGIPNNGYGRGISSGVYGGGAGASYGGGAPNIDATRSMSAALSNKDVPVGPGAPGSAVGASAPLMSGGGAGDTSVGSHQTGPSGGEQDGSEGYAYKAKALYACKFHPALLCQPLLCSLTNNLNRHCIRG